MSCYGNILRALAVFAALAACRRVGQQAIQGHRFACADYSGGKVFLVDADGKVTWEYPASNCNDLWVLPNGNLLFNTGHGVKEVTREKNVVFHYDPRARFTPASDSRTATRLSASATPGACWKWTRRARLSRKSACFRRARTAATFICATRGDWPTATTWSPTTESRWSANTTPQGKMVARIPRAGRTAQRHPPAQRQHAHRLRRHGQRASRLRGRHRRPHGLGSQSATNCRDQPQIHDRAAAPA